MQTRRWTWSSLLLLGALAGCAAGEGDGQEGENELGTFEREAPVRGDLYIEVTDARGDPLRPDTVVLSIDGERTVQVQCMDAQAERCEVWLGDFEAMKHVTAWAERCGHRFGAAVPLGPDVDEDQPFEGAVTIIGVPGLCGSDTPLQ